MRYEKINLTVKYKENYLDIRISNPLTWFRLEKLLYENVVANLSFPLDGQMHLQVKGKNIHIEKSDLLAYYPIGNGDVLEIIS